MRNVVVILSFVFMTMPVVAQIDSVQISLGDPQVTFQQAIEAYKNESFEESIALNRNIIDQGLESAEVYFNMGNAYFKLNDIPNAILYYERAKKLNPQDEDLNTNLEMANLKTVDKVEAKPELAVTAWWKTVLNISTVDEWARKSIFLSFLALAAFLLFIVSSGLIKRISFFSGAGIFVVSLLFYFLAMQQQGLQESDRYGIIFTPSVTVKSAPEDDGNKIFVIHEGTKVKVHEVSGEWSRISLMNGNKGWILSQDLKTI